MSEPPECFRDLNFDQLVSTITSGFEEYDLAPYIYSPLNDVESITYRQEIMEELQHPLVLEAISSFSLQMRAIRERLLELKSVEFYKIAAQRRFLEIVRIYVEATSQLSLDLSQLSLQSRGIRAFLDYLQEYIASATFQVLANEVQQITDLFSQIRFSLVLNGGSITVCPHKEQQDYSTVLEEEFEKFRLDSALSVQLQTRQWNGMNHVEAQIQERVALLFPNHFERLNHFYESNKDFLDETLVRFEREIQFYIAYLRYIEIVRQKGLQFCRPTLATRSKTIASRGAFDLVLARKRAEENAETVTNDFFLRDEERVLVVSGPNQGGKTTFARMIAQMHYLAALGCIVPGIECQLFLFDRIFTHFEREEDPANLRGKLQDDLVRMHQILTNATPDSLIVMNETFSSTTLKDALSLSEKIMKKICELDLIAVWVTFLDELASYSSKTVSMVSTVDPNDLTTRTFRFERRPPEGLAYALALAQKYRVTYENLKERIRS
jgi:DNA mismatch repair ATPase MutS